MTTLAEATSRGIGGELQTGPFGSQLHASDYQENGIPVVMPKDIVKRRVSEHSIARIEKSDAERLAQHQLRAGDLIFSRRGDVEKHALIGDIEQGWLCGTGCLRVRFGRDGVAPAYASAYLDLDSAKSWISRHAVGLTMPNINTTVLGAVPFLIPAGGLDVRYACATKPLEGLLNRNLLAAQVLATVRDELLPKLLSGELRVPDAERAVADAP